MDDADKAQILELLEQGLTSDDIVRRLGVAKNSVAAVKAHSTMGSYGDSIAASDPREGRRFVMIREGTDERLVREGSIPTEAALHEVLMRHSELIPAADLGFGRLATVGFEAGLASGSADLVLLDAGGRVCIVEVKKEGNPDTRRVVAQLLDYAAALWNLTVDEFELDIFQRMPEARDRGSLRDFILEKLVADEDDPDEAAERTLEGLEETLRTGDFTLLLAAPIVPSGVRRVLEYLNAREVRVFGLEVSYFAGEVEAFVPRVVVRPSRSMGQDVRASKRAAGEWDQPRFVAEVESRQGSDAAETATKLFGWAAERADVTFDFGKGANTGTAALRLQGAAALTAVRLWSDGGVQIPFSFMGLQPPFGSRQARNEFRRRVNDALPEKNLAPEEEKTNPGFTLTDIADSAAFDAFVDAIEWAFGAATHAQQGAEGEPTS